MSISAHSEQPKRTSKTGARVLYFRADDPLTRRIRMCAAARNVSPSELIRATLNEHLPEYEMKEAV